MKDPDIRMIDQSQIGRVLTGDAEALRHRGPVTAMLIQNTNPVNIAPEQRLVKRGFARDDLFVAVHEQFMTDTAEMADIVMPATMFVEHDDIYRAGGQNHILLGPKLVEPPSTVRTNLFVIEELAKRLGVADRPGFGFTAREMIDRILGNRATCRATTISSSTNGSTASRISRTRISSTASPIRTASSASGRTGPTSRRRTGRRSRRPARPACRAAGFPDQVDVIEVADADASVPARDIAGAQLPQFELCRDQDLAPEGRPPGTDDQSRGCRRRLASPTATSFRSAISAGEFACMPRCHDRRQARRADRRGPVAEQGACGRRGHQRADRRRSRRALWRRRRSTTTRSGCARMPHDEIRKGKVEIVSDETLSNGWTRLSNYIDYTDSNGETHRLKREVYHRTPAPTILLYDPKRDTVVLVRQFRLPAHLTAIPAG
jgi:hypothetical protein